MVDFGFGIGGCCLPVCGFGRRCGGCCFEFRWWFSGFGCVSVFWTVGFALDLGEFGGVVNWCLGAILAVSVVIVC